MMETGKKSMRILHVVAEMHRGGIETWLMNILRRIDRGRFHMDFLVRTTKPCDYDEEIRSFGSDVIPCLSHDRPFTYARNFKKVLREHGPYDIIHSHFAPYTGYILYLACKSNVPVRIAHSHLTKLPLHATKGLIRRIYRYQMARLIRRYATVGLASSQEAAEALFGPKWEKDTRRHVFYCGIDTDSFHVDVDRASVREELGIPPEAFVIGHVGRFVEEKNHVFLIEILREAIKQNTRIRLLMCGDGPLRPFIENKIREFEMSDYVFLTGTRSDIPRLMVGAIDAFCFPSLFEGLGLVLIEAQAAGIPCVYSNVLPKEADIVNPLLTRLSLDQPVRVWTEAILEISHKAPSINGRDALAAVENSEFDIKKNVRRLESIYEECWFKNRRQRPCD